MIFGLTKSYVRHCRFWGHFIGALLSFWSPGPLIMLWLTIETSTPDSLGFRTSKRWRQLIPHFSKSALFFLCFALWNGFGIQGDSEKKALCGGLKRRNGRG